MVSTQAAQPLALFNRPGGVRGARFINIVVCFVFMGAVLFVAFHLN